MISHVPQCWLISFTSPLKCQAVLSLCIGAFLEPRGLGCFSLVWVSFMCVHGDSSHRGGFLVTPKYTADPQWIQGVSSLAIPAGPSCLSVDFQDGHRPLFFSVHQDLLTQSCGSVSSVSSCPHREARQPCLGRKLHLFSRMETHP